MSFRALNWRVFNKRVNLVALQQGPTRRKFFRSDLAICVSTRLGNQGSRHRDLRASTPPSLGTSIRPPDEAANALETFRKTPENPSLA